MRLSKLQWKIRPQENSRFFDPELLSACKQGLQQINRTDYAGPCAVHEPLDQHEEFVRYSLVLPHCQKQQRRYDVRENCYAGGVLRHVCNMMFFCHLVVHVLPELAGIVFQ